MAPPVRAANPTIVNISTQTSSPLPLGFSGFNMPQLRNGVEYFDPKFVTAVTALKPGALRFPAGTASLAYDWNAGQINPAWLSYLTTGSPAPVDPGTANILSTAQQLTQAKGGVRISDFATFAHTFGSPAIICVNGYTDNNPGSTAQLALAAQSNGLNVLEWELANEPYIYPRVFPAASSYALSMYSPYFTDLTSAAPGATVGLFSAGYYTGENVNYTAWDGGLSSYSPRYWNAASIHVYPIAKTMTTQDTWQTLNGILAHGTADYINSYLLPLVGANTPVFITEFNCCQQNSNKYVSFLFNGIFMAEYIARMSAVPNVKVVQVNSLYTDNYDYHGALQSVNDFESYLFSQLAANPTYSTNTATDPNTQFQFYTSAAGVALSVANMAINGNSQVWPTTVTNSPTVPIKGYDGQPVPAVYAQAYQTSSGGHSLLITNKCAGTIRVKIQLDGVNVTSKFNIAYVSNSTGQVANSAQAPNNVAMQVSTATNPISVGPNSVTAVSW